jgi:tRNA 2-thiouridine synthesizing protein C
MSMAQAGNKAVLIVLTHSPYGSSLAKAALDVAFANAAFEQSVDLLFLGDGVLHLLPEQDSQLVGMKNAGRQLASLPLYDINWVYVDAEAAAQYKLDLTNAPVDIRLLGALEMHQLMVAYDHLLGF